MSSPFAGPATAAWRVLQRSRTAKINLRMTLCGGQCFHWYRTPRDTFIGAIGQRVFELREVQSEVKPSANAQRGPSSTAAPKSSASATAKKGKGGSAIEDEVARRGRCCWVEYRLLWPPSTHLLGKEKVLENSYVPVDRVALAPKKEEDEDEEALSFYLSLDVDLNSLWKRWTDAPRTRRHPLVAYLLDQRSKPLPVFAVGEDVVGPHATTTSPVLPVPIRHVRQDLHSCLFSFLCSQNNNVSRITSMIYALCRTYGEHLCDVELLTGTARPPARPTKGKAARDIPRPISQAASSPLGRGDQASSAMWMALHSFPTLEQLTAATEEELRELGFGYRSKYIVGTVSTLHEFAARKCPPCCEQNSSCDPLPLSEQRQHQVCRHHPFYATALNARGKYRCQREQLLQLPGVGRKVADCVALFALGNTHIVPVDTHMAQVAVEYLTSPGSGNSSISARSRKRARREGGASKVEHVGSWQDVLQEWGAQARAWEGQTKDSSRTQHVGPQGKATPARPQRKVRGGAATPVPPLQERHHDAIQEGFAELFGDYAGWAHSILFFYRMRKGIS